MTPFISPYLLREPRDLRDVIAERQRQRDASWWRAQREDIEADRELAEESRNAE